MFRCVACSNRASPATSPKSQPSPYITMSGSIASSASRTARMLSFGWWPIRSNRKPSTLYASAHSAVDSTTNLPNMACSGAVFWQHVEV